MRNTDDRNIDDKNDDDKNNDNVENIDNDKNIFYLSETDTIAKNDSVRKFD